MTVETVKEHLERQCVHVENRDCNRGVLINKTPVGNRETYHPTAHRTVQITCDKYLTAFAHQGRVVRKPVNVNPGLNVN